MSGGGGIAGLKRLVALTRSNPLVKFDTYPSHESKFLSVVESGQWRSTCRTFTVYGLMYGEPELLSLIARDIECIAVEDHFAKAIFTYIDYPARKLAAVTTIIGSVINQGLIDKVKSCGARIDAQLSEIEGVPAMVFTLFNKENNTELVKFSIDGWSGRISVGNAWGDTHCNGPQQIRELIYSALTDRL